MSKFGNDWDALLTDEMQKPYYLELRRFLKAEYATKPICPPMGDVFSAMRHTPYNDIKIVILGQDPYINPGEAHGMAFSVMPDIKIPPSLRNIFKELQDDMGCYIPNNGHLMPWAKQGILLLNTVLTAVAKQSKSHANKGWERFTDNIISLCNQRQKPIIFMLWGRLAQQKAELIDDSRHKILMAAHPSPLAGGAFFGCRHFSLSNSFLSEQGEEVIDWQIDNI